MEEVRYQNCVIPGSQIGGESASWKKCNRNPRSTGVFTGYFQNTGKVVGTALVGVCAKRLPTLVIKL